MICTISITASIQMEQSALVLVLQSVIRGVIGDNFSMTWKLHRDNISTIGLNINLLVSAGERRPNTRKVMSKRSQSDTECKCNGRRHLIVQRILSDFLVSSG